MEITGNNVHYKDRPVFHFNLQSKIWKDTEYLVPQAKGFLLLVVMAVTVLNVQYYGSCQQLLEYARESGEGGHSYT